MAAWAGTAGKNQKTWENVSFFNGERPIVGEQSGAGAINRIIDLEVDKPLFTDFAHVLEIVRENNGHAGEVFVAHVQSIKDSVLIQRHKEWCQKTLHRRGKHRKADPGVGLHPPSG